MQTRYDHLVKVTLVGDAQAGKSSLFQRWVSQAYSNSYISTIGVDFGVMTREHNSKTYKFQIWDTAGQECYRTITSAYYRGADIIIYTLDASTPEKFDAQCKELAELKAEVDKSLESVGEKKVIRILALTKTDKDKKNLLSEQQIKEVQALLGLQDKETVFTSAKEDKIQTLETRLLEGAQEIFNPSIGSGPIDNALTVTAIFNQALASMANSQVPQPDYASPRHSFQAQLEQLKRQTLIELNNNKLSLADATSLANSAKTLAGKVADGSLQPKDIEQFHNDTIIHKKTVLLGRILGALIGAAIGVFIGVMIGIGMGPGAAATALYAGAKGAVAGAAIGGTLFGWLGGRAGKRCTMWQLKQNHPALQAAQDLEEEALAVEKMISSQSSKAA